MKPEYDEQTVEFIRNIPRVTIAYSEEMVENMRLQIIEANNRAMRNLQIGYDNGLRDGRAEIRAQVDAAIGLMRNKSNG